MNSVKFTDLALKTLINSPQLPNKNLASNNLES